MITQPVQISCDKCGLSIEPLDAAFDGQHVAGGGSLIVIARANGGLGHNQIPLGGWHFHYLCFSEVARAVQKTFKTASTTETK